MRISPEVQTVMDALRSQQPRPMDLPQDQARALYVERARAAGGEPVAMADVRDHRAELEGRTLKLRVYRPEGIADTGAAAAVFFHGGGWVFGDLDSHDSVARQIAARAAVVLIAVDYRLAPEHPLPAASDDAVDVFEWIVVNAESLGVDAGRLAVIGDSAGGHLSAVVALAARDRGLALRGQILIYPATDLRASARQYPSRTRNADFVPLNDEYMNYFVARAIDANTPVDDWHVSPLAVDDATGVAPAFVLTAGADILMDEGVLYAQWLTEAGVDVEHVHYRGVIHGFIGMFAVLSVTDRALTVIGQALRARLA